jgi:hypothetical protein
MKKKKFFFFNNQTIMPFKYYLIPPSFLDGIIQKDKLSDCILDDIIVKIIHEYPLSVQKFRNSRGIYGIIINGYPADLRNFRQLVKHPIIQKFFWDVKNWWKSRFLQQQAAAAAAAAPSYLQSWKRLPQQGKSVQDKMIW